MQDATHRNAHRSDAILARLKIMDRHLRRRAQQGQREDPERGDTVTIDPFAKFPARQFNYLAELDQMNIDAPATEEELLDEIAHFFRGAQRPESPYCLFNMNVVPTVDATAAACLAVTQNVSCLMDMFGGESLLVEQKVARTIGRWVGWHGAMGIACSGGKITMQYALRSAIARAQPASSMKGITGGLVVLCSASAHYSVEHVATSVGIGAANCVRVPVDSAGRMCTSALLSAMERVHAEGKTIAAVICCGGTIVNFCFDDTTAVYAVVDRFTRAHCLSVRPYLHLDSVIGWLYFAFSGLTAGDLESAIPDDSTRNRIAEVTQRCASLHQFDSFGVDFHKTGLCPETNSFFVAPDRRFMDELGTGDYRYHDEDFAFGNLRAYRYTFENSRPAHGILAAWVNLRLLGREGFRRYLVGLHRARSGVEQAIQRHGQFTLLNPSNLGWEVLFHIPFETVDSGDTYRETAIAFMEHCWRRVGEGHELPLFSIVPEYHIDHDRTRSSVAFLLYPMADYPPVVWDSVVAAIARELRRFEPSRRSGKTKPRLSIWEKPIR